MPRSRKRPDQAPAEPPAKPRATVEDIVDFLQRQEQPPLTAAGQRQLVGQHFRIVDRVWRAARRKLPSLPPRSAVRARGSDGALIAAVRHHLGLSAAAFGAALQTDTRTITRWEAGASRVPYPVWAHLTLLLYLETDDETARNLLPFGDDWRKGVRDLLAARGAGAILSRSSLTSRSA